MLRTIVLERVDKGVSPHAHDRKRERDEGGRETEEEGRTWKAARYKLLTSEASAVGHQAVLSFVRAPHMLLSAYATISKHYNSMRTHFAATFRTLKITAFQNEWLE